MATFLDLPREIYLMICSLLTTLELKQLASVSRDHYLAVQQPLYSDIRIPSYGALVKLVYAVMKTPVVSHISASQRQRWYRLHEAELSEREICALNLTIDMSKEATKVTGAPLARCIGAISRKNTNVKISLTLLGISEKLLKELTNVALPAVTQLTMFLKTVASSSPAGTAHYQNLLLAGRVWALTFSGSTFPDLQIVYMNSLVDRAEKLPIDMEGSLLLANSEFPSYRGQLRDNTLIDADFPFYGLLKMREIKLELNTMLDSRVLNSLFGSKIIPQHLTKLEIVHCPRLHPIKDLAAIAMLLTRGLKLLNFLKIHLSPHFDGHDGYGMAYSSKISECPEHHLCNIVRQLGQDIKGLDLALPFACARMLLPSSNKSAPERDQPTELPKISRWPFNTLPERLMADGYRYRRIIFNGFCRDGERWDEMATMAGNQGERISWELLYDSGYATKAMWFVSGFAPRAFSFDQAMKHPFDEVMAERSLWME